MRIVYYTTDEVNRYIVRRWGRHAGVQIDCPPEGGRVVGGDGPIILDFDFLPADVRVEWLRQVRAGAAAGPVLVHGHNIADADADTLVRAGGHVCRGRVRRTALDGWLDTVATRAGHVS